MQDHPNDHWSASFTVDQQGGYEYKIEAWVDHLANWFYGFKKKQADGQDMQVELEIGIGHLRGAAKTYSKTKGKPLNDMAKKLASEDYETAVRTVLSGAFASLVSEFDYKQHVTTYADDLRVWCGRRRELFSSWYELFPRSTSPDPSRPGTFKDTEALLPRIHEMGFNVLYFPPIHPIGKKNRKGRNNATTAKPGEPGSPWAIGSDEGGHKAILPELGTLDDYKHLIEKARNEYGIDIALDLAFQCAPDHPYITEHPDWFIWRPDGTIAYAENPPKKYQDIVPINFETDDWKKLWEELLSVVLYWCEVGVTIFRVDNPHTKPYRFWEWLIAKVLKKYPDTIFLSEAFTRPAVMAELAKRGFTQSYTYFTWRNTAQEMRDYLIELTQTELREYMRPNFWPNTPDILTYEMMGAGSNQFVKRVILAGTLSSNYGLYGPSYEFMENTGHTSGKEEYYDSEKYTVRHYDWNYRTRVSEVITRLNEIRNNQPALQTTWNIHFTNVDNPNLLSYLKWDDARTNFIWSIVNFDPNQTQSGMIQFPREVLGTGRFEVTDLLTNEIYYWGDDWNFVMLDPNKMPAHILRVQRLPG
jgi:starch synthase (maltosyl-transferring)